MRYLPLLPLFLFLSCTEILSVPDISLEEILLYSPKHDAELTNSEVIFSWSDLDNVDRYRLQLFRNDSISTALVRDTLVLKNQFLDSLDLQGNYRWRVRGENFGYTTSYSEENFSFRLAQFSDNELILNAPSNNATILMSSVLFSWDSVKEATQYRFQMVQSDFRQAEQFLYDSLLTQPYLNLKVKDTGSYEWRVRGEKDMSTTFFALRSFSINDPLNGKKIELLSPENNRVIRNTSVNLNWAELENSPFYTVQVATPDFDQSTAIVLDSTTTQRHIKILLDDHMPFSWRVKGIGEFTETPFESRKFRIATIDSLTQKEVHLLAPANNSILESPRVNLTWYAIKDAERYHVQIATPSFANPLQIVYDEFISDFKTTATLQATSSFEWRVKAINEISETAFFSRKFKIK